MEQTSLELPTIEECYALLNKYCIPINIVKHCEQTTKIAVYLAKKINEKGETVNIKVLARACLVHDVGKPIDFENVGPDPKYGRFEVSEDVKKVWVNLKKQYENMNHENAGAKILSDYPEIAKLIKKHHYMAINENLKTWEEKLIFYADKLVMNTKITSLKQRIDDAHKRYKTVHNIDPEKVINTDKKIFELEKEILDKAGVTADELIKLNDRDIKEFIE